MNSVLIILISLNYVSKNLSKGGKKLLQKKEEEEAN